MTYQPFQSEGRSKRRGIVRVDRRTREGKLLEQIRAALTAQVGGSPNFVQCAIIERAAFLSVEAAKVARANRFQISLRRVGASGPATAAAPRSLRSAMPRFRCVAGWEQHGTSRMQRCLAWRCRSTAVHWCGSAD